MKIVSFIACEDVRREVDGKTTLVGIYEGLSVAPEALADGKKATIRFATHLRFLLEPEDVVPDDIQMLITYNGSSVVDGNAPVVVNDRDKPIQLAGPMIMHAIAEPGVLKIQYKFLSNTKVLWAPVEFEVPILVRASG